MTDLDALIYQYDATGSPTADLLRELKATRALIAEAESFISAVQGALPGKWPDEAAALRARLADRKP